MADSLLVADEIELLGGGVPSTNPLCYGAIFHLGQGFDLGAPQPTTDFVASLLLDGERPFGRRAANRTVSLPITIEAPDRLTLAAAREVLEQAIDQQYWLLTYTRDSEGNTPLPFVLQCFRANATAPTYNTRFEKQATILQLTLNFTALPYGRSDAQQLLAFSSPVSSAQVPPPPPSPVVLDNFTTINSPQCQQSTVHIVGPKSLFWDPLNAPALDPQGQSTAFSYSAALGSVANLTSMAAVQLWVGFGSRYYYNWHHYAGRSRVRIDFSLTDSSGQTLAFSRANLTLPVSEDPHNPAYSRVTLAIPQGANGSFGTPFDYASVVSYAFTITNRQNNPALRYVCCYVDAVTAYPSTQTSTPVTRGNLYNVYGVIGTVHTPCSLQFQQPPTASTPTTITGAGSGNYTVPFGTVYLKVELIGGGGAGASQTLAGEGGGGGGAEYSRENVFLCKAGDVISYVVGTGGTSGSTPTNGGTSAFGPAPNQTLVVTANGGQSAIPNSTVGGRGGTGSTNSVHYDGGAGRTASGSVGGGGGSSAGTNGPGLSPVGTQNVVFNTAGTNVWVCPNGVSQIFVQLTGAGAGGASGGTFTNGGGGGGGETTGAFVAVTATHSYSYTVGTGGAGGFGNGANGQAGGSSSFAGDNGTLVANGGQAGTAQRYGSGSGSGSGGSGTTSTLPGFVEFPGGNGGGAFPYSGGGGSSAGSSAAGNNGDGYGNPGSAPTGGGSGGAGSGPTNNNGQAGSSPGGGGGGTYDSNTAGPGAAGQITISYPGGAPTNNGALAVTGGGAGGQGGGTNNTPGNSGLQPGGGGGGGDSAGSSVSGGNGAAGWIIVTPYVNATFNTLIVHHPAFGAPNRLVPCVPINGGNGTTGTVPAPVTNTNAVFSGTYTLIATNNTWNSPTQSRTISATITQYEYPGSAGYPQTTVPIAITPSAQITNGIVVLGNLTLPFKSVSAGNTTAYYTATINDSNGSDTFFDILLLDTMGQTAIINVPPVSVTAPGIPGSGGSVANSTGYPVTVTISGGSVTNVSINGVTVGMGSGAYTLLNGQTIALTYGSAPSWTWVVQSGYKNYYIDEPRPDVDIGGVYGSNTDRSSAISVLDKCLPLSGGPISLEPNDNVLFAYCMEGPPLISGTYYPRYYFDRIQ